MNKWFRSWHGAPMDPKWLLIGRRAGVAPALVSAIFWALCDHASQAEERGSVADFDVETYAIYGGIEEEQVHAVIAALAEKEIIVDGRLAAWEKIRGPRSNRPHADEWNRLRRIVFRRDNYTCQYCGAYGGRLECDHVMPVSRGGSHALTNLVTACFTCNRSKRDKTPEEWLR